MIHLCTGLSQDGTGCGLQVQPPKRESSFQNHGHVLKEDEKHGGTKDLVLCGTQKAKITGKDKKLELLLLSTKSRTRWRFQNDTILQYSESANSVHLTETSLACVVDARNKLGRMGKASPERET